MQLLVSVGEPANSADFYLVGQHLAADLESSISEALSADAIFNTGSNPLAIFRGSLAESFLDIERHPRGRLLQRFLRDGPYEGLGEPPAGPSSERLTDEETADVTAFIFGFMVNSFKGVIAELLACAPILEILRALREEGRLRGDERLFVGDSVQAAVSDGRRFAKAADLHVLVRERIARGEQQLRVAGVAEVKSYPLTQRKLRRQLNRHVQRSSLGLLVGDEKVSRERIRVQRSVQGRPVRIAVVPSGWRLPRTLKIEEAEGGRRVRIEAPKPLAENRIVRIRDDEWRVTLRWSQEALASAAYEVTFWYMEKVGEIIYREGVPDEWSEMTPAEAGRNAVKMMLYYAILRSRSKREEERAIALYNTYSFGYALGMSFRKRRGGRREMLWPEDLDEIAESGTTPMGCRFW